MTTVQINELIRLSQRESIRHVVRRLEIEHPFRCISGALEVLLVELLPGGLQEGLRGHE